jgi:hypothetical protein
MLPTQLIGALALYNATLSPSGQKQTAQICKQCSRRTANFIQFSYDEAKVL